MIMFQQLLNPNKLEAVANLYLSFRTEYFANSYYIFTVKELNNLRPEFCKSVTTKIYKTYSK